MAGNGGVQYHVKCIGKTDFGLNVLQAAGWHLPLKSPSCGWMGLRISLKCECTGADAFYCRPTSPGPDCPAGDVLWCCPRCGGAVSAVLVKPRKKTKPIPKSPFPWRHLE